MNTEEIIKLAREAASGMLSYDAEGNWHLGEKEVERFATLVRTAALEEAIKVIEEYRIPVGNSPAGELACDWTRDALADIRDAIWALK